MRIDRGASGGFERAYRLAAALVEHVADDDSGTGLRHQPRRFGADPARRPRNQRDLAIETVHRLSPISKARFAQTYSREHTHSMRALLTAVIYFGSFLALG